jgi:dolichol-phosphate mannosyltransferase
VGDILVVDDASPDGKGDVADELARRSSGRDSVLRRPGKLGLRAAYREGLACAQRAEAEYECVFQMDADYAHWPTNVTALYHALDQAAVALGSQRVAGGAVRHWPVW